MENKPTPETDAEANRMGACGINHDFCAKLERERDQLRKELTEAIHAGAEAVRERNELRKELHEKSLEKNP